MQSARLTAEMELVLACCRWPPSRAGDAVAAAASRVDWPCVLVLARRHRVQGLVHHVLAAANVVAPEPAGRELQDEARHIGTRNLRLAAESLRLERRLRAAGVATMIVKGSALAMLAYGTLAAKMAWDIDLLVPADAVEAAADVLEAAGYACILPGPTRAGLSPWHRYSKESVWRHRDNGIHVELHSALVDSPLVLPGLDARSPGQQVAIAPGIELPTLRKDDLFAYLCVHGAASGWRRLKWLADVAALLSSADAVEVTRLYAAAEARGAGRVAGQALLLCYRYLAVPVASDLLAKLRRDHWTRLLAHVAGGLMTAPDGFDDPKETALGTWPIHAMQMLILPGWRFPLGEMRRKMTPDPRVAGSLSRVGRWSYPLAALGRRMRRKDLPTA